MDKIQIIKNKDAIPLDRHGDILFPFENWETTTTGGGWYSKTPEEFYENKKYIPLTAFSQNSWKALVKLNINCFDFKEKVQYECPYNKYIHYWCIPILIFTNDIKYWLNKYNVFSEERYLDFNWMKKFFPIKTKNGLPFTKIQRALLGSGYTNMTRVNDGNGYIYDALVALDNDDNLGVKVWMWFNK